MVEVAEPLSTTLVGLAEIPAAEGGDPMKFTVAVWVKVTLSLVSLAVKVKFSTVVSVTLKMTAPLAIDVTPEEGVITALPPDAESVNVLPATSFPLLSSRSTTMEALDVPSAGTVPTKGWNGSVEVACTDDMEALGLPGD